MECVVCFFFRKRLGGFRKIRRKRFYFGQGRESATKPFTRNSQLQVNLSKKKHHKLLKTMLIETTFSLTVYEHVQNYTRRVHSSKENYIIEST